MTADRVNTGRLLIRKMELTDLDDLYQLLSDSEVMRYLEPPYSREKTEAFLRCAGLCEPPLIYGVEDVQRSFAGYVIYHDYDEDSMEIGWVLKREFWHRGYGDELTKALVADAGRNGKDAVIECVPEQETTRKIALKNGFVFCGKSGNCDVYRKVCK